jgi:aspartate aminotransferase/aminotransferase
MESPHLPNVLGLTRIPPEELPPEAEQCMRFAPRMDHVGGSRIHDFLGRTQHHPEAMDLSVGQADFDVPAALKEKTLAAVHEEGCGRYSPPQGYPELVAATRRYLGERYGLRPEDEVMMTHGVSGGLTLALLALAGPGDEVLVPDPYFVTYRQMTHIVGATPVYYDLYPDLRPDIGEIERRITERTRLIILNSPANPTGVTLSAEEMKAVADLAQKHHVPVVSDELYELFTYDAPHVSIKHFLGCRSLLVSGFSKTYGMAGWRLGWAAGAPELIDKMRALQLYLYTCPSTLAQRGALAAFDVDMSAMIAAYRRKRDMMYDGLVSRGYDVVRPGGSFFLFPRVPWGDDLEFCERALAEHLILLPGSAFRARPRGAGPAREADFGLISDFGLIPQETAGALRR